MKQNSMVAFPEKYFPGVTIAGLRTLRVRIDGRPCLGVPFLHYKAVCKRLGVKKGSIALVKTDHDGLYLATLREGDRAVVRKVNTKAHHIAVLRGKYIELCGYSRKAERVQRIKQETETLRSEIEKCQHKLVTLLRKVEEAEKQTKAVVETDEVLLTRYGDDFNQLLQHPDLLSIEISGNTIIVYTKPVMIHHRKVDYDIGKFKIYIHTHGVEGGVRMINLTRRINLNHHPHISGSGIPCLGNIREAIPHMIAEHQYPALVAVCIEYLKSYDASDGYGPYIEIENWPRTKIQTKRKEKKNENR